MEVYLNFEMSNRIKTEIVVFVSHAFQTRGIVFCSLFITPSQNENNYIKGGKFQNCAYCGGRSEGGMGYAPVFVHYGNPSGLSLSSSFPNA